MVSRTKTRKMKKQISLLLLILLLLVPAIHKLMAQIPPDWFMGKFEESLIAKIPGGLHLSFYLILLLEIIGPLFLLIALAQMNLKRAYSQFLGWGFTVYYGLFLLLTFGSFLVQDYDNGFKDFMYFIGVMVIERFYFSKEDSI